MPWPDNGTHGTQSGSGHAQEQQSQNPGSPWLAAGHWRRTRLLIEGARYGCTSLSSEIPQPDGAATPGRTSTIAEGNRQDGRPKREVADNAEALGAELAERRYLRRTSVSAKDRIGSGSDVTGTYPDLPAAAVAGPQAVPPSGIKQGCSHKFANWGRQCSQIKKKKMKNVRVSSM
jgi:hypothetical protein